MALSVGVSQATVFVDVEEAERERGTVGAMDGGRAADRAGDGSNIDNPDDCGEPYRQHQVKEGRTIDLQILDGNDMTLGGMVAYDPTGLRILTSLNWEQTKVLAEMLQGEYIFSHRRLPWYIGDLLNWAEDAFGEAYPQLILEALSDYERNTLRNWKFVTSAVRQDVRRNDLFFSHHAEVASLVTADEKRFWLNQAVLMGWTRDELRKAIRESRLVESEDSSETPIAVSVDTELPTVSPLMVQIMGLANLPDSSALRRIKTEALPALAQFMPDQSEGGRKAELALFKAVDEMLDAWYSEIGGD